MSELDPRQELFELMCKRGIEHFKAEVPVMELTEEGYVDTGKTQPVWKSSDVAAFTGLLKLADFKYAQGMASSAAELRAAAMDRKQRRAAVRNVRDNVVSIDGIPPLDIAIGD